MSAAPEHIVFVTGKPRPRPAGEGRGRPAAGALRLEHRRFRGEGRRADDRGDHQAAASTLPEGATRVVLPGRCRANPEALAAHFGLPVERGPDEIVDLPAISGLAGRKVDLSRHDLRIFSEIVDASKMTRRADPGQGPRPRPPRRRRHRPRRPAGHAVSRISRTACAALKGEGLTVSVDSFSIEELRRGAAAGADFLLSLNEETLDLAFETEAVPILVPTRPDDLPSLDRAIARMVEAGRPFIADPILEPIHFGFVDSIARYRATRARWPDIAMMMGTGNLTELTEADSLGVTALLVGMCSELSIRNVLIVQVSNHTRRTVEEHDAARRVMYAAKADAALPKGYGRALLALHDKRPFVQTPDEIAALAAAGSRPQLPDRGRRGRDPRLQPRRPQGRHRRDGLLHRSDGDLASDGAHAFYLGAELAKAETAWRLGKRYVQDEPLDWGCAADAEVEDTTAFKKAGHTRHSGPDAPPPGTRDAQVPAEADASAPAHDRAGRGRGAEAVVRDGRRSRPHKLVCGRLVPAEQGVSRCR